MPQRTTMLRLPGTRKLSLEACSHKRVWFYRFDQPRCDALHVRIAGVTRPEPVPLQFRRERRADNPMKKFLLVLSSVVMIAYVAYRGFTTIFILPFTVPLFSLGGIYFLLLVLL